MTKIGKIVEAIDNKIYAPIHKVVRQKTITNEKTIGRVTWLGNNISSPQNRLIMGVTAIMTQPFIDLNNKDVDEKTRIVSCAKTLAKILTGTTTGVIIRHLTIKLAEKMSRTRSELNAGTIKKYTKFNRFFSTINHKPHKPEYYKQYRNTIGTFMGIVVMLFTNFAIDMPLTNFFTNVFSRKFQNASKPSDKKGGAL